MKKERIRELYTDFENALKRLDEAVREDLSKGDIIIDGTIQRFEFTFELSWKLMRAVLDYQGINTDSPRSAIKEIFKIKLIKDGEGWIDMLEDRNKTSHIYDEKEALKIYKKIKQNHIGLLADLKKEVFEFLTHL